MELWHDFFMATAGAAAALTGLIFVGVSINLTRILSIPHMPERALISLILLLLILVISILSLVPEHPLTFLGIEILVLSTICFVFIRRYDLRMLRSKSSEFRKKYILNMSLSIGALVPYFVGAVLMLCSGSSGIYWLIPAFIFSFLKSVLDAWVLLVEINR